MRARPYIQLRIADSGSLYRFVPAVEAIIENNERGARLSFTPVRKSWVRDIYSVHLIERLWMGARISAGEVRVWRPVAAPSSLQSRQVVREVIAILS